jgi:hypothetical protein
MGIFSWFRSHRPSEIMEDQDDEPPTLIRHQPVDPELEEIRRAAAEDVARVEQDDKYFGGSSPDGL